MRRDQAGKASSTSPVESGCGRAPQGQLGPAEAPSGPPRDVLAVDIAFLFQALPERSYHVGERISGDPLRRKPITGIVACCARAASGHAAAALTSVMNSRRLMAWAPSQVPLPIIPVGDRHGRRFAAHFTLPVERSTAPL